MWEDLDLTLAFPPLPFAISCLLLCLQDKSCFVLGPHFGRTVRAGGSWRRMGEAWPLIFKQAAKNHRNHCYNNKLAYLAHSLRARTASCKELRPKVRQTQLGISGVLLSISCGIWASYLTSKSYSHIHTMEGTIPHLTGLRNGSNLLCNMQINQWINNSWSVFSNL